MINAFTFLTLLLLFVRIYSMVSLLFLNDKRVQFAERITILILLFEVLTIFLYSFFTSFRYLLPPALILLKTPKYLIFKNFSLVLLIYSFLNLILSFTFNSQDIFKFINRFLVGIILLTNIIYGFLLIL
ncbi:hypothetical protein Lebu_1258 [Leptotrichia buccalis C-1013-b]|uniref:Uncharacterized protein n=1 Tax=Leptotrichia buccalis (strain ATCC 14201 / DSM 1135 / JCM 12969 / NCTC 10249 / C-1013-b) TaxID=523794 RepID=C7NAG6_LEPBD|nr:hypothetical protein Lebu_1258 [Leptotrichia buccalis C-1013-b]